MSDLRSETKHPFIFQMWIWWPGRSIARPEEASSGFDELLTERQDCWPALNGGSDPVQLLHQLHALAALHLHSVFGPDLPRTRRLFEARHRRFQAAGLGPHGPIWARLQHLCGRNSDL